MSAQAGPARSMNWYNANGNGSTTPAGFRGADGDAMNGNAVMFDAGKILVVGGSPSYVNSVATSNASLVRAWPSLTQAPMAINKMAGASTAELRCQHHSCFTVSMTAV